MSQDAIEFPDEWLTALQPRRTGRRGSVYRITDEQRAQLAAERKRVADKVQLVLANPVSDPRLVKLAGSMNRTSQSVGVRLALETQFMWGYWVFLADECVRLIGLPAAAAACVESFGYGVVWSHLLRSETSGEALVPVAEIPPDDLLDHVRYGFQPELLDHLRRLLSVVDEPTWQATVEQLTPYRTGLWRRRLATSFLVPDRRDWVQADLDELPTEAPWWVRRQLAMYCGYESAQFRGVVANQLDELVTMIDALEHEATPYLLRSFDWWYGDSDARARILDVLTRIPSTEVMAGLLARISFADVADAFETAAARRPAWAREVLLAHEREPFVPALLARHRARFPQPSDASTPSLPVAPAELVPSILSSPPWDHPPPQPIALRAPDIGVQIRWLDGEREQWSWDGWPTFEETHYDSAYTEFPDRARFYIGGSEAAVRPRLATWAAERASFYLERPEVLVGKYELDAYPPVTRLARAKPSVGARLLLPYLSADVARTMAKWLATSRQFRPVAEQWFDRHGAEGVMPLLPIALGQPTAEARTTAHALARLDPDLIRAAARELGEAQAAEELLSRDPLHLLPSKPPALPSWLDLAVLPPIRTRDGAHRLGLAEVGVLCRMVAMSQLDDPYAGLSVVAVSVDPASLAEFAWQLSCAWHFAGRPSKDAWALDALAYFGNASVAERLAPLVRRWPSDGAAQRAKRGAEILGRIDDLEAVRQLSSIARSAKSIPLRKHAAGVLDRLAAERGMLPEQLDDLLAPDLGLDGDPVEYRGVAYETDIGNALELVLRDGSGQPVTTLPKRATDEEKAVVQEWVKRRRAAGGQIAEQARRLEEAMVVQRRWTAAEFGTAVAAHPLLGRLARRLVWDLDDRLATVDALGDLVDSDGGLIGDVEWVHLAHPATASLDQWRGWFATRHLVQPFEQVDRIVYDGDPSSYWGERVRAASLHALTRRGWHWGTSGHAAVRTEIFRPFGAAGSVALHITPGVSAVHNTATEPDQTIEQISLHSLTYGDLAVFGDLPRVTRSELVRDLALLERL